ncbi:hypothetical protein GIV21_06160 [Pseudomonas syringae]|uniref:hypothetical protein n=1 Tax=Pseudomonas syringae TaxID=317 RepID=UPI002FD9979B|nr:hypothetical protein [Pseudomonas syringae]
MVDGGDVIDLIQWPAMAVTLLAAWFIGSQRPARRMLAFWCVIFSNFLWIIWGLHAHAYALIVLQAGLCVINLRGFKKNRDGARGDSE